MRLNPWNGHYPKENESNLAEGLYIIRVAERSMVVEEWRKYMQRGATEILTGGKGGKKGVGK